MTVFLRLSERASPIAAVDRAGSRTLGNSGSAADNPGKQRQLSEGVDRWPQVNQAACLPALFGNGCEA
jgi:hypothetical protein